MPDLGRVLGLDLGDARIGVAISDDQQRVAVPFGTIRTGAPEDLKAIAQLVADNDVSEVVVGHPLKMSGDAGPRADKAAGFADVLRSVLSVPVSLQDERLSTVEAERALKTAGATGRDRKRVVDQAAATVILQSALDLRLG
ncbi:MAG: Holliday junction resolvase RuvX [Actinomycetota bacterium]